MKRIIFVLSILSIVSCSKSKDATEDLSATTPIVPEIPKLVGDQSLVGYQLIKGSDCMSCHRDNGMLVGPSYADVKQKYTEKDTDYLASKIIEGGSGVWGDVAMQPHPQITKEEAKQMVAYILSMK